MYHDINININIVLDFEVAIVLVHTNIADILSINPILHISNNINYWLIINTDSKILKYLSRTCIKQEAT